MKNRIADIISGLLILLFAYTAFSKLADPLHFQAVLSQMLLIKHIAGFISFALPVTELIVCALLLIPNTRISGLYSSFGLLVVFTLYVGYMILFDSHLPCSCGGVLQKLNWTQHLIFNVVFIALSLVDIKLYQPNKKYCCNATAARTATAG